MIQADEGLRECELRKLSALAEAIERGFRRRGLDDVAAQLAAQLAVTVFSVTITRWLDQNGDQPPSHLVHDTLRALRSLAADPSSSAAGPVAPDSAGAAQVPRRHAGTNSSPG